MTRTVLIVAHAHPDENPTGGELAAYELFTAISARPGYVAHFAAPRVTPRLSGGRLTNWAGRSNEWELPTGQTDGFLLSQRDVHAVTAFAELLRRLRPDVVHLHHYMRSGVEALGVVRNVIPQALLVVTLHEFLAICANNGQMVKAGSFALCERSSPEDCSICFPMRTPDDFAIRRRYVLGNLLKSDILISPSDFLRQRYVDWGVPANRIMTAENHIPLMPRLPPRPLVPGARRAAFGYFGSVGIYKGVRELVEAFCLLRETPEGSDATLTINGMAGNMSPAAQQAFKAAVDHAGSAVRLTGRYGRDDLPRLMAEVDWVVMPSIWWENSPIVIQEALMFGRPLIVSDIGGMAEKVRSGIDGFTFPAADIRALADTMAFAIPRFDTMRLPDMAAVIAERLERFFAVYEGRVSGVRQEGAPS